MSAARLLLIAGLIALLAACQPVRPEAEIAAEATAQAAAAAEATLTPAAEVTEIPVEEATPTPATEATATPAEEATPTTEPTATPTEEPTPTATPTATPTEEPTPTATPTQTAAEQAAASKAVVDDFFAALNARDAAAIGRLAAGNRAIHSAAMDARTAFLHGVPVVEGRTFPDFEYTPHALLADGDLVAAYLTFTGTQEGALGDRAASGRPTSVVVLMFHRVEDGRIAESWAEWDNLALLAQLGLVPEELSPPDPEAVPVYPTLGEEGDAAANAEVVRQFFAALDQADYDQVAALLAPDFAYYSQADPGVHIRSAEAMIAYEQANKAAVPDLRHDLEQIVAEGDLVAALATFSGTNTGPLGEMPATGMSVSQPLGAIFRLEDGQIAEMWSAVDNLAFFSQLGLLPAE